MPVKNPKGTYNSEKFKTGYRWQMFFSLNNDPRLTRKYIHSVEYKLHPSYRIRRMTVTEPPFFMCRSDYGSFVVAAVVHF